MNILVGVFVILMIWRIRKGYKNGFVKEAGRVVALFTALIVLAVLFLLIASILEKNVKMTVVSIILLFAVSIFCGLINVITKSMETLAKLPLIRTANSLLGAAAGVSEIMIAFWIMYMVIESIPTGMAGEQILAWTNESPLLLYIYHKNYIANWIINLYCTADKL